MAEPGTPTRELPQATLNASVNASMKAEVIATARAAAVLAEQQELEAEAAAWVAAVAASTTGPGLMIQRCTPIEEECLGLASPGSSSPGSFKRKGDTLTSGSSGSAKSICREAAEGFKQVLQSPDPASVVMSKAPAVDELDLEALKEQEMAEMKLKKKIEEKAKKAKAKDKEEASRGGPSARFSFMPREDTLLLEAAARLGKQWRKIAEILPGRTENSVHVLVTLNSCMQVTDSGAPLQVLTAAPDPPSQVRHRHAQLMQEHAGRLKDAPAEELPKMASAHPELSYQGVRINRLASPSFSPELSNQGVRINRLASPSSSPELSYQGVRINRLASPSSSPASSGVAHSSGLSSIAPIPLAAEVGLEHHFQTLVGIPNMGVPDASQMRDRFQTLVGIPNMGVPDASQIRDDGPSRLPNMGLSAASMQKLPDMECARRMPDMTSAWQLGTTRGATAIPDELVEAAQVGNVVRIRDWLWAGGDVDARDSTGRTMLMFAAAAGRCAVVEVLLAARWHLIACDDL